jgi:hypothetical protein
MVTNNKINLTASLEQHLWDTAKNLRGSVESLPR